MTIFREERGPISILIACGRSWFVATCIVVVLLGGYVAALEIHSGIGAAAEVAAMVIASGFLVGMFISFPFVFLIAAPTALLAGQVFGRRFWLNSLTGAMIGAGCGVVLAHFYILPDIFWSGGVGAIYGATTGYFLTRIIYA